jgi:hypothetical protein
MAHRARPALKEAGGERSRIRRTIFDEKYLYI